MGQARIIIDTTNARISKPNPKLAAFYKLNFALEKAFEAAGDDEDLQWAILDKVREFVNQKPYEMDGLDYKEMRIWWTEFMDRINF